jgi:hypothetical protein
MVVRAHARLPAGGSGEMIRPEARRSSSSALIDEPAAGHCRSRDRGGGRRAVRHCPRLLSDRVFARRERRQTQSLSRTH